MSSLESGRIERLARRATAWTERWMPDAFVFALAATLVIALAAFAADPAARQAPLGVVDAWGVGFWTLIPFTLQMTMIIIGGYVLATSPPVFRLIVRIAAMPRTAKGAVLVVALVAMATSLLNWGFSLIVGAVLAREVARRVPEADYRALGASSFLGLGTVWAQGLSGSAALQMASASSMPPRLAQMVGEIPLTDTIFLWQSLVCVAVEMAVVAVAVWLYAPSEGRGRTARDLGIDLGPAEPARLPRPQVPGEWLEHSPVLVLPIVALGFIYLAPTSASARPACPSALNALDFNTMNLLLLVLGALLHWTPASLMRAVREATPATWGVLLQFPFYAGIFGIMTGTHLSDANRGPLRPGVYAALYPAVILTYSGVLGMFVPSGGAKWVIEAPYVLQSAHALGVHSGWMVIALQPRRGDREPAAAVLDAADPRAAQPQARDIMGYTFIVALVLFPFALVLITVLRPS